MDPNPAKSAHVVYPQSGHIRPEKRPFFQIRTHKKIRTAHSGPIYQIKAIENPYQMQKKSCSLEKNVCLGKPLNLDILPAFEDILGIMEKYRTLDENLWGLKG